MTQTQPQRSCRGNKLSGNRPWAKIRQRQLIQCSFSYRQSVRTMSLDCRHICAASCVPPPPFACVSFETAAVSFAVYIPHICVDPLASSCWCEKEFTISFASFFPPWRQSFSGVIIYLENPPGVHGTSVLLERKCAFVKYQDASFVLQSEFCHLDVAVQSVPTLQRMNCKKSPAMRISFSACRRPGKIVQKQLRALCQSSSREPCRIAT
jgi:hypothetical protein